MKPLLVAVLAAVALLDGLHGVVLVICYDVVVLLVVEAVAHLAGLHEDLEVQAEVAAAMLLRVGVVAVVVAQPVVAVAADF